MNGMGGGQPNKLSVMMAGMLGGGNGANNRQGPPTQGPSPGQPTGLQQPTDPAYPGFVKIKEGLKALSDMLSQLGDSTTALQVDQMAIDLIKLGDARSNDMLKKMQLEKKLGSANAMINGPEQQGAQQ